MPKNQSSCSKNRMMSMPGYEVPTAFSGALSTPVTKPEKSPNGVSRKSILMMKPPTMMIAAGTKAVKDREIDGGTLSGIWMTKFFWTILR